MKNLMIALCFGCFLYSCSTNDPEPEQKIVYVDKIIEVEKPVITPESLYPDSLKWFIKNDSAVYYSILNNYKNQGLTVISYGNNSRSSLNFTGTSKFPWHSITVITYRYTEKNGNLDVNEAMDFVIGRHGMDVNKLISENNYWMSNDWNSNFYSGGQIILASSTNP